MDRKRKLLSLISLISLACCAAFVAAPAQAAPEPNPFNVAKNYDFSGWYIKGGANFDRFSNNGTSYANSVAGNDVYNIGTGYHFGYNLGLGYQAPGTNTTYNLKYTSLETKDQSSIGAAALTLNPDLLGPINFASGELRFTYSTVDLNVGHIVPVTQTYGFNYWAGLEYSHFNWNVNGFGTGFGNTVSSTYGTSFNGLGPDFGFGVQCHPISRIPAVEVYANAHTTFLFGTMSGYVYNIDNGVSETDNIPDATQVIPVFGGDMGLRFNFPFHTYNFALEVGYETKTFFGVARDAVNYNNVVNASYQGLYGNLGIRF